MIRIAALFLLCLVSANPQGTPAATAGLQASIDIEEVSTAIEGVAIEGKEPKLQVIRLTINNTNDSPQSLVVGSNYNNADHWNVGLNLMRPDGKIVTLSKLPRMMNIVGPPPSPVVIEIPAHGAYPVFLAATNFEEETGDGGTTNLANFIGARGVRLQVVLHCGVNLPFESSLAASFWKGDLVSGWIGN